MNLHDHGGLEWPGATDRAVDMALRQSVARKAGTLRRLHRGPELLVLPNAWDAASAKLCAAAGFPAVATTSAGVVEALGHDDDDSAPAEEVFAVLARTAAAIEVPLTVDVEGGYGLNAADLAARIVAAGAVGLNLEDTHHRRGGLRDVDEQADRIAAVKAAGRSLGVDSSSTPASTSTSARPATQDAGSARRSTEPGATSRPAPTACTRSCWRTRPT